MRAGRTRLLVVLALVLQVALAHGQAHTSDPLAEAIREHIDALRYADERVIHRAQVVLREPVARVYEARQFKSAWSDPIRLNQLIAAIGDVEADGLDPRDYHLDALIAIRDELLRAAKTLSVSEQADLELLATDALGLAMYHLYAGKVDPVKLSTQWNFDQRQLKSGDGIRVVGDVLESGRIAEAMQNVRPAHPWYQLGRERLREYRRIAAEGGWPAVPAGPTLKLGMTDPRVAVLRERLRITGDLAESGAASGEPAPADAVNAADVGGAASVDPVQVFDADVEAGVRHFQTRHGLATDGHVGPATLAAIRVPVQARIDQIRLNLERGRWVLHEIKGDFVLVDVAGFYVSYFRDDKPVWTSKVVVGKPYRETPIFKSKITYVVFNPTWTIPPGILAKDKLPIIKRDPGYLARNRIRVIDSRGREVPPYSVDWNRYSGANIPYQLRQDPGPDNALGLVKIMFPNPYLVYLHDSPAKALYGEDTRTFSSGCIRVERAFELAELVLNDPQRWNQQTMQDVIKTARTQTVNLAKPLPVMILYWTAQPTPDGQVVFRTDVYGRDPPLLKALDNDFRLPAPTAPPAPAG
jgi:murein L,D-transpeptidase YcbB/YkuD